MAPENEVVYIFNPRQQRWNTHFAWNGVEVIGLTGIGRATVQALDLNRSTMLAIRAEEELRGRHPPPEDINPVDTICDKLRKSANCQGGRQKNVKQDETLTWQAVEP